MRSLLKWEILYIKNNNADFIFQIQHYITNLFETFILRIQLFKL